MKVMLVHAYRLAADPGELRVMKPYPPLGVLYLSAYLKRIGHEVEVYDGTFLEDRELAERVARFAPEVLGFYANMMTRHRVVALRQLLTGHRALYLVGGPDPPHYAEAYLDQGFDAVVVGEGEQTLAELLAGKAWAEIAGLVFRQAGELVRTPARNPDLDLDSLPFPDRAAIELDKYLDCWDRHHGMRPISLITSRGCPYQCTWCAHNVYGHSLRKRSPESVVAEMAELHRSYRFDHLWFADDVFNIQPKWLLRWRDALAERPELRRPFECIARADRCDSEQIQLLAELGCSRCWIGAESGSQRLLDAMKRGVKRDRVAEVVTQMRRVGIRTGMFFMWGFQGEELDDVFETVELAETCLPDVALTTVAYPIKGTAFHDALARGARLGDEPAFLGGTDRDIPILGQQPRPVYALADALLHSRMQVRRLREGSRKARIKALAHLVRAWWLGQRLRHHWRAAL